jgi:hypothetical protein
MPKVNEQVVKQLEAMGFDDSVRERPRRLVASVSGKEKVGKTHFALTAPDPIFLISVDIGTEGVVDKFQAEGKRIYIYEVRLSKTAKQDVYVPMWENLKKIFEKVYQAGAGTVVVDSVAADSPLLLKDPTGHVWIGTIEDFWEEQASRGVALTEKGEQVVFLPPDSGWRTLNTVWSRSVKSRVNPWTPVQSVIRHPYKGSMLRVTTAGGTIRVTSNHSLARAAVTGGRTEFVDASVLKVGDELSLPMYSRTASNLYRQENGCHPFIGPLELAWLYGFFVAEGCAYDTHDKRFPAWRGCKAEFCNRDIGLINKAKAVVENCFHVGTTVTLDRSSNTHHLVVQNTGVANHFGETFYNSRREKIVPQTILNSKQEIKQAFLQGYLDGDGHCGRGSIWSFDTTSPALAMAIIWMERSSSLDSRDVSVYTRQDKPSVTAVQFPRKAVGVRGRIRSIVEEQYEGMVYDLETENHAFCAGVGGVLAHNTATEVWELARLAKFGKLSQVLPQHYTEVNNEFRELLRMSYDASFMNSIFIHKMKAKYINNARTNEYEPSGFGDMEYTSQVNVILDREDTDEGPRFTAFIKDCRHNPNVNGQLLEGEMCSFEFLLGLIHGD